MAGNMPKDIRKWEVSTEHGKHVTDTKMISGEAKITSAFKEKNSTTQHTTSGKLEGPWGGEAKY